MESRRLYRISNDEFADLWRLWADQEFNPSGQMFTGWCGWKHTTCGRWFKTKIPIAFDVTATVLMRSLRS